MDIWVVGTSNHGNVAFSILVYSAKKQYCSFLKNIFIFQKICFKVKVLETFKISSDCHIKTSRSLKRKVTLKILSTVFQKNLRPLCWLSKETSKKKRFPMLRQKTNSNFAVKRAERINLSFSFQSYFYFFVFDESPFSNICKL